MQTDERPKLQLMVCAGLHKEVFSFLAVKSWSWEALGAGVLLLTHSIHGLPSDAVLIGYVSHVSSPLSLELHVHDFQVLEGP